MYIPQSKAYLKIINRSILAFVLLIVFLNSCSAAHFIIGVVNDSIDGAIADGRSIYLWNPEIGLSENLTDIIGASGNAGSEGFYMIDCELLSSCEMGDVLSLQVMDNGDGYITKIVNATVSGAGYDLVEDMMLHSFPIFHNITVDDDYLEPRGEIDLTAANTKSIKCSAEIEYYDGINITNASGVFFSQINSTYGGEDDNNNHYSNSSCAINYLDEARSIIECGFDIWYYSNSGEWNCSITLTDELGLKEYGSNNTIVNRLMAISLPENIDYGKVNLGGISDEGSLNISNYGNTMVNLSLFGFGSAIGDEIAMNCTKGKTKNISLYYEKYNLTGPNPGILTFNQFESSYLNLTSGPLTRMFNLNSRQDDNTNDAIKPTYWRIFVPSGVDGDCSGNIVLGAMTASEEG